ncbi:MAG: RagB/SusD family nutrient uptake outer membrane protein [Prevotella sp.]|nr:RagB/SusD family nutrient uptake outer membrane protein [Prevotella sp.]
MNKKTIKDKFRTALLWICGILAPLPWGGVGGGLLLTSCVDTVILPDDKTVDEDFWKSKSDVQLMVNGAYRSMLSPDIISRLIVWGGLRSEELLPVSNVTGSLVEDLTEMNLANTQPDNVFARWAAFYHVINNCNLVLSRAESVMYEDPSYTEGDYLSDCSQMLALRALCYFYLVRNFRDVPYVTEAFMNSSQDRNIPQMAPDSVLTACIRDLKTAEQNALSAAAFNDWRRVGYMTRDAIQALLADIYLWRASVLHSPSDYQACVDYCDKVIASKKSQHVFRGGQREEKDFYLATGPRAFSEIFIDQNAEESIFELQYNGVDYYNGSAKRNEGNFALCQYYTHYSDRGAPYLYAASIFQNQGLVYTTITGATGARDWRGLNNTYNTPVTVGSYDGLELRKYVADNSETGGNYNLITSTSYATKNRVYDVQYTQNFIIYRLTDVMLMKAEALTALATADDDILLRQAFNLVQTVNSRSKTIESSNDSIHWVAFNTGVTTMEELVMNERLRELAFEGKRWYDLMRYNYRHVEGVDYTTTLASQDDRGVAPVSNYNSNAMMKLAVRKLSNGDAVAAKMSTEPKLYLPIPLSDINVCPVLRQNPAYGTNDNYSKNY